MKKKYRAGIVGCGRAAFNTEVDLEHRYWITPASPITHIGALRSIPAIDLVAICDIDRNAVGKVGQEFDIPRQFTAPEDMVREEDLDIVVVATPIQTHVQVMKQLAETPVKGILLEKPIASSLGEARELQSVFRGRGKSVLVNMFRRFDETHQRVLEMIRDGAVGKIRTIIAQWEPSGIQECGIHALDLCCYYSDSRPEKVMGRLQERERLHDQTSGTVIMEMENGIQCIVWVPQGETKHSDEIKIIGDEGFVRLGKFVAEYCRYETYGSRSLNISPVTRPLPIRSMGHSPMQNGLLRLLQAVEAGNVCKPDLDDGYLALETVIASYVSSDTNRWVSLPLDSAYDDFMVF